MISQFIFNYLLISIFILVAMGCSSIPTPSIPSMPWSEPKLKSNADAETLYKRAMSYFNKKKYARAIPIFEKVKEKYPFSTQASETELKLPIALYLDENFLEAIKRFKDFLALHPTHEKKPMVIYYLGLAHYDQFNGIDREPKNIRLAMVYFKNLVKDHPKSEFTEDAAEKFAQCREYIAERELYVARFYLKNKKYLAAIDRLQVLLQKYRDTSIAVKGMYQLGEVYRLQKNTLKAALAFEALIQHYGNHPLAKKATKQLSQLERENQDPLAMLMMRDGRRVYSPPPESMPKPKGSRIQDKKSIKLVAKNKVVKEELGVRKGVFQRVADTINPFSSSEKSDPQEDKEDKEKKKDNGKDKRTGFFANLWPFGDSKNDIPVNQQNKHKQEETDPRLATKIDSSLDKKGISASGSKLTNPTSPIPNLPEVKPEFHVEPKKTAKVLKSVDKNLKKQGKNLGDLPPVPTVSSDLFAKDKSSDVKGEATGRTTFSRIRTAPSASSSSSGLLATIDAKLKKKSIKVKGLHDLSSEKSNATDTEKVSHKSAPPKVIELSPRVAKEKQSQLLNAGEFGFSKKPSMKDGTDSTNNAADGKPESAKSNQNPDRFLESVTSKKSSASVKEKTREIKLQDHEEGEQKGVFESLNENFEALGTALNPFNW